MPTRDVLDAVLWILNTGGARIAEKRTYKMARTTFTRRSLDRLSAQEVR